MGKKVDYRNNKKELKRLKLTFIIIGIILIIYILVRSIINALDYVPIDTGIVEEQHSSVTEYKSLASLLARYNCTYLRESKVNDEKNIYVNFDKNLYTNNVSNENYFVRILQLVAEYEKFVNFKMIDTSRNIEIEVLCEDTNIVQITINGETDYYLNHDSELNSKKQKAKITDFTIQSNELKQLIKNDWSDSDFNFGTKDSTCENYNIFFDEGFKYKKVGRKVFNLIFTEKYEGKIAGGLGVSSTKEEIVSALGEPTFTDGENMCGYLGSNNYLFFDFMNKQVSIYPKVELTNEEEFVNLINEMNKNTESIDVKTFAENLIKLWNDYDVYDYDSDYIDLRYTLMGIQLDISASSLQNGIYLYSNYSGDIDVYKLKNVYLKEEDFVFETEKQRSMDRTLKTSIQGDISDEDWIEYGMKFGVFSREELAPNEKGIKGLTFYSRDGEYPDTELDRTLVVSSYNWYDEYNFIYSVDNDGIYVFNPVTNKKNKLIDVEGDIIINEAGNGKIVYNDTEKIEVNIN